MHLNFIRNKVVTLGNSIRLILCHKGLSQTFQFCLVHCTPDYSVKIVLLKRVLSETLLAFVTSNFLIENSLLVLFEETVMSKKEKDCGCHGTQPEHPGRPRPRPYSPVGVPEDPPWHQRPSTSPRWTDVRPEDLRVWCPRTLLPWRWESRHPRPTVHLLLNRVQDIVESVSGGVYPEQWMTSQTKSLAKTRGRNQWGEQNHL